jgi:hypothetical protein
MERKIPLLIMEGIQHSEAWEGAFFLLMQTVPCVLHLENCVDLKILMNILEEGLSKAYS